MDPMLMLKLAQQFKQGGQGQDQQQTGTSQMGAMSQQGGFLQKIMEAIKGGGQSASTTAVQAGGGAGKEIMPSSQQIAQSAGGGLAGLLNQSTMTPDQIQAILARMGNGS